MPCSTALGSGLASENGHGAPELPDPAPRLLALWAEMGGRREPEADLAWRVEHWRLLNGDQLPFDPDVWRAREQRANEHAGRPDGPTAHAFADQWGLERGAELARVRVPTLVIEAPADPINPPPHAVHLAAAIRGARLVRVLQMGHALHPEVLEPLATAILTHAAAVDATDLRP